MVFTVALSGLLLQALSLPWLLRSLDVTESEARRSEFEWVDHAD